MKSDPSKEPLRKRLTRIFALLGACLLIGLYIVTLILGLTASDQTQKLLMASIVCTVVIPVLIYAMMLIARVLDGRNHSSDKDDPKATKGSQNRRDL